MMPMRMRTGKKTLLPRFLNAERTSCAVLTGAMNQLTRRSACACDTELSPEPRFASERREAERRDMLGPARTAGQRQGWVLTLAAWPWSRCSGDHVARSCGAFTGVADASVSLSG